MGQTDGTYKVIDHDGMEWTWVYVCPFCDAELATLRLVESMNLEPDDIIGCDQCCVDVSIEASALILVDVDGNRG